VTGADQFRNQTNEIPDAPRRDASHGVGDRFATTQGRALWVVLYRFPTAFQWVTTPLALLAPMMLPNLGFEPLQTLEFLRRMRLSSCFVKI
jgi:hypothetical protein